MIKSRCKNCTWHDAEHSSLRDVPKHLGYCRKKSPIVFAKDGRYYTSWPLTDMEDFCGEFREDMVENGMSK